MSFLITPTTNVDLCSLFPPYGIIVGTGTAIINIGKSLKDLHDLDVANTMGKVSKSLNAKIKFKADYSKALQSLWEHLTYIIIGILRILPLGGLLCFNYHKKKANQLIQAAENAESSKNFDIAINNFEKGVAINGSKIVRNKLENLKANKICQICCEDFTDFKTPFKRKNCLDTCNKTYTTCKLCIEKWVSNTDNCPACKMPNPLDAVQPSPVYARRRPAAIHSIHEWESMAREFSAMVRGWDSAED